MAYGIVSNIYLPSVIFAIKLRNFIFQGVQTNSIPPLKFAFVLGFYAKQSMAVYLTAPTLFISFTDCF